MEANLRAFVRLTSMVTSKNVWLNPFYIMEIEEIEGGSRVYLSAGSGSPIRRVVKETPEEIFEKIWYKV